MRKTKGTITGSWINTLVYCMNEKHPEPILMPLDDSRQTLIYQCPKCGNKLSMAEFEKMLDHLQDLQMEAAMTDTSLNLTNYTWKERSGIGKGNSYKVLHHNDPELKIGVVNPMAVSKE